MNNQSMADDFFTANQFNQFFKLIAPNLVENISTFNKT